MSDGPPENVVDDRPFRWFERIMVVTVGGITAVGLVALAAAVIGVARPVPVAAVALVAWAGIVWAWWRGRDPEEVDLSAAPARTRVRGAVIVGVALLSCAHNLRHQGAYVVVDRDPGIYVVGGRWVAERGDLEVDGLGPGLEGVTGLHTWASGQSGDEVDSAQLEIQGAHLFHVYLAVGHWVAGTTGMFAVPALLGGWAVLAFGWMALRLLRGWWAVVVVGALVVNLAWLYAVRSILSEPTLLLLSFAGTAMLLASLRTAAGGRLFVAGLVSATALTARVDAGVVLMLAPALTAALLVRRSRSVRGAQTGHGPASMGSRTWPSGRFAWWAAGWLVPLVIAGADLSWRSSNYLGHLREEVLLVGVGLGASTVLALVILAFDRWWDGAGPVRDRLVGRVRAVGRLLPSMAVGAAVLVVVVVAFAWFIRPGLGPDRQDRRGEGWRVMESIQVNEGLDPDGRRTYAERSLDRINWYTGPVAVVLGAAGAAVLTLRILQNRARPVEWAVVALVVPCLVLYVYRPSIYSDHPWMIRRYIPTAIPGILLFAGVALEALGSRVRIDRGVRRGAVVGVTALAALGLVVAPAAVTWPLRAATWQADGHEGIGSLCEELGPRGTALLGEERNTAVTLLPSVRSFCQVPAARVDPSLSGVDRQAVVEEAARRSDQNGRSLRVVSTSREEVLAMAPEAERLRPVVILQTSIVGSTIARVPSTVADHAVTVWVGDVNPAGG